MNIYSSMVQKQGKSLHFLAASKVILTIIALLFLLGTAKAQDPNPIPAVTIGSGSEIDYNIPTNISYGYSLTQQIYTADELGSSAGIIQSIDFYYAKDEWWAYDPVEDFTRNLDIYIVSTDKTSFENNLDWVNITENDLCFSGEVTFDVEAWTTITLTNPFFYDGSNNIVIVTYDKSKETLGLLYFSVFEAEKQSLYIQDDGYEKQSVFLDPFNPTSFVGEDIWNEHTLIDVKNQIRINSVLSGEVSTPKSLAANYTGGSQVELSWSSSETSFEISVNDVIQPTTVTENPYTLSLQYKTEYTVMVRAKNGDNVSEWSDPVTFTTDYCAPEDMCQITFELLNNTESNGWNGAAIKVYVVEENESNYLLGTVTLESGTSKTTTLNVPDSKEIKFEWISAGSTYWGYNYDDECSYTVKNNNGVVIFSGEGAMTAPAYYDVDCNSNVMPLAVPTNLTATEVTGHSATLSWEGNNNGYELLLKPWVQIGKDVVVTGKLTTYSFDLSNYSGNGSIVIRHYDVIGQSRLLIDDIVLTDDQNNTILSEDFEADEISQAITKIDLDGDGSGWDLGTYGRSQDSYNNYYFNGNKGYDSKSMVWDTRLSPDDWLIISGVKLGGTLSFKARNYISDSNESFGIFVCPDNVDPITVNDNSYSATGLYADSPYYWQVRSVEENGKSSWATGSFMTSNLKVFRNSGDWNVDGSWEPNGVPTYDNKVRIDAAVTIPAGVTAQAMKVILNGASITIEEGAQLKQGASSLKMTMKKSVTGGTDNLISSPVIGRTEINRNGLDCDMVDYLIGSTDKYDLYAFDPTCTLNAIPGATSGMEWINGKITKYDSDSKSDLFKSGMLWGNGYYYANNENLNFFYIGPTWSSYQNEMREDMTYDPDCTDELNGWKLVGNPYTCDGEISYSKSGAATFYKLNSSGKGFDVYEGSVVLAPGEGAFIKVTDSGSIIYSSEVPASPASSQGTVYYPFLPQRGLNVHQDAGSFRLTETDGVAKLISNYQGATDVKTSFMRSFSENVASTVCLPFPMTGVSGGTLYEFVDVTYDDTEGWVATMEAANLAASPTVADQPYLFMPGATGDVTFSGFIGSVPATISAGSTTSTYSGGVDWTFSGTYTNLVYGTDLNGKVFGFAGTNGKDAVETEVSITAGEFVRAANGATVKPFRAYLTYSGSDEALQAPGRGVASTPAIPDRIKVRLLGSDGTETAVGTMDMRTGNVMTGEWYDMYGRRLDGAPTGPGLYINNGRKVIIR
ncbi:MAG: fibronectin type III domain-containing protein [Bacteroidaceae bacterium]|nr:fibronectin type III domain-containing protein [Bacteroidaceae bacterium]